MKRSRIAEYGKQAQFAKSIWCGFDEATLDRKQGLGRILVSLNYVQAVEVVELLCGLLVVRGTEGPRRLRSAAVLVIAAAFETRPDAGPGFGDIGIRGGSGRY